jgi:hypothetical protein
MEINADIDVDLDVNVDVGKSPACDRKDQGDADTPFDST